MGFWPYGFVPLVYLVTFVGYRWVKYDYPEYLRRRGRRDAEKAMREEMLRLKEELQNATPKDFL